MLRNNLVYIKEQLTREEKIVRKEIEQIKFEQQNLKETFEKVNQKVDELLEQRNIGSSKEPKLNNLLKQFENFNLGEKPIIKDIKKIKELVKHLPTLHLPLENEYKIVGR